MQTRMEGEIREKIVKDKYAIGSLARITRGRNAFMELTNSILLPTLMYGSGTWTWNGAQQSKVCAVK